MSYDIKTPAGQTYSKHNDHSSALRHMAESLESRGIAPTVKNAMEHGFSMKRNEHGHPHSEDPVHQKE